MWGMEQLEATRSRGVEATDEVGIYLRGNLEMI